MSIQTIELAITQLKQHFSTMKSSAGSTPADLSIDTLCRFLSGMTVPLFTRAKVRQLSFFGVCQAMRYAEIKAQVINLSK